MNHSWHQDVKPRNILVCSRDDFSPYDCDFKLADLGLSHFKKVVGEDSVDDTNTNGTPIYGMSTFLSLRELLFIIVGAPECYRDKFNDLTKLTVRQNVDIWSLGCILSEAAVWVVQGWDGLKAYRSLRHNETARIHKFDDQGCFHNSKHLLDSVKQTHHEISRQVRERDFVTKKVVGWTESGSGMQVTGIIHEMLNTPDRRPSAAQAQGRVEDAVIEAQRALTEHISTPSRRSHTEPSRKRLTPPVKPPELVHLPKSDPNISQTETRILGSPFAEATTPQPRPLSSDSLEQYAMSSTGTPNSNVTPTTSPVSMQRVNRRKAQSNASNIQNDAQSLSTLVRGDPENEAKIGGHFRNPGLGIATDEHTSREQVYTANNVLQSVQPTLPSTPTRKTRLPYRKVEQLQLYLLEHEKNKSVGLRSDEHSLLTELAKRDYV